MSGNQYDVMMTRMRWMRKSVPHSSILGSLMVKFSRDGPTLLITLATRPSVCWGSHHAFNVRIVDMSITVCAPRSQRMNTELLVYKYSRRHGDLSCNSTALISLSMARMSSGLGLNSFSENSVTERRFKGEQSRLVKCASLATQRTLTSKSTKHGRANNARNAALVSGIKPVRDIPLRTSFRTCVSIPSR